MITVHPTPVNPTADPTTDPTGDAAGDAAIRRSERIRSLLGLSYAAVAVDCALAYRRTGRRRYAVAAALGTTATVAMVAVNLMIPIVVWGAATGHAVPSWVAALLATAAVLTGSVFGTESLAVADAATPTAGR